MLYEVRSPAAGAQLVVRFRGRIIEPRPEPIQSQRSLPFHAVVHDDLAGGHDLWHAREVIVDSTHVWLHRLDLDEAGIDEGNWAIVLRSV